MPSRSETTKLSDHVAALSRETFASIRDVDHVSPHRTTKNSHTTPSGACHTTPLPTERNGSEAMRFGADHLPETRLYRDPNTPVSTAYSPSPP